MCPFNRVSIYSLALLFALTACGGGGGGGGGDDGGGNADTLNVQGVSLSYPTMTANLGGKAADTLISGRIPFTEGTSTAAARPISGRMPPVARDLAAGDIDYIDVNGQLATLDANDPSRWSVRVPVAAGGNAVAVTLALPDGETFTATGSVDNSPPMSEPQGVAIDLANNRAYVTSDIQDAVLVLDLVTGARSILSDDDTGTGPGFSTPQNIVLDLANNRALVVDVNRGSLFAVDLTSGDRIELSNEFLQGSGPPLNSAKSLVHDGGTLVYVGLRQAIVEVDLANNGDRRSISDNSGAGAGTAFSSIEDIALDAANNRLLAIDSLARTLFEVDLTPATLGDRSEISNGTGNGSGPAFTFPIGVVHDAADDRALVIDFFGNALIEVDLTAGLTLGDRIVLSGGGAEIGTGPSLFRVEEIAFDAASKQVVMTAESFRGLLSVNLNSVSGNRSVLLDASIGSGLAFVSPRGVALDVAGNRVLTVDPSFGVPLTVDIDSGDRGFIDGSGVTNLGAGDIVLDLVNNRALMTDVFSNALIEVDLASGDRVLVSGSGAGSGINFSRPEKVAVDAANDRALVIDTTLVALIEVDLVSGERSSISDGVNGTGPVLMNPADIAFDAANNRALVVDTGLLALVAIDLTAGPTLGDRSILSDVGTGSGPDLNFPRALVLDAGADRVLVVNSGSIFSVDLGSGDRLEISAYTTDNGPLLVNPNSIEIDAPNNRAFVVDSNYHGLFVIDLDTGERAIVSQ